MKKAGFWALLFVASFGGVLAALQVDRMITARGSSNIPVTSFDGVIRAKPAEYDMSAAGGDFRAAAKKLNPSIVSVDKAEATRDFWTDEVHIVPAATGSGVVISKDGYILTNNHVVADAAKVTVRMSDQKSYPATVVGTDERADLAVIKISADNLVAAEMGDSDALEVGEWVMAVGNPLGMANTVSVGVVSSLKRTLPSEQGNLLIDSIQTDAAINGGNSGGALANSSGQVVGINAAIMTNTGGSIGLGFAIPINRAKKVVSDILKYGYVKYGYAGFDVYNGPNVLMDENARRQIAEQAGAQPPKSGLIITRVRQGSPAANAGIAQFNVILEAEGKTMSDPSEFMKLLADKRAGDSLKLKVWERGNVKDVSLTLEDLRKF